jgi:hypothetical protein
MAMATSGREKRRWIVRGAIALGAAGVLALGLSVSGLAGVLCDCGDGDGVLDEADNCLLVPNGPDLQTGFCNTQLDGDMDGYGNPCDTDVNNDGATALDDVNQVFAAAVIVSTDPI